MLLVEKHEDWLTDDKAYLTFDDPAEDTAGKIVAMAAKTFRDTLVTKYLRHYQRTIDPDREITVVCGSTEGMMASLLAVTNPGGCFVAPGF